MVTVTWVIKPQSIDLFREKITEQAAASVSQEEGCLRFDVCEDRSQKGRFLLYEVYTSEAAFHVHLKMDYSLAFLPLADRMTASKEVAMFDLISAN